MNREGPTPRLARRSYSWLCPLLLQPDAHSLAPGPSPYSYTGVAGTKEQGFPRFRRNAPIEAPSAYRGFNLFARSDVELFLAIGRAEWCIRGFKNADVRRLLPGLGAGRASHLLRRLRLHQLITRVARGYRYRLTEAGQRLVVAALRLRQQVAPALAAA